MWVCAIRLWTLNTPQNSTREKQDLRGLPIQTKRSGLAGFSITLPSNEQRERFLLAVRHIIQILSTIKCSFTMAPFKCFNILHPDHRFTLSGRMPLQVQ